MDLSGLLPAVEAVVEPAVRELDRPSRAQGRLVLGAPDGAKACVIAAIARRATPAVPIIVIAPRPQHARSLAEELAAWLGDARRVLIFPERESLPYERLAPDPATLSQRLGVLRALDEKDGAAGPPVVVASGQALAQRTLSPRELSEGSETVAVGSDVSPDELLRRLALRGHQLASLVDSPGQAARRGGIIDVFPPADALPLRLEFLGERVETIRQFDPDTQRSLRRTDACDLGPAREALLPSAEAPPFLSSLDLTPCGYQERGRYEREMELLAAGEAFDGDHFYTAFLATSTLLDHLTPEGLVIVDEPADLALALEEHDERTEEVRADLLSRGELPGGMPLPHLPWRQMRDILERPSRRVDLARWAGQDEPQAAPSAAATGRRLPFSSAPSYGGRLRLLAGELAKATRSGEAVVAVTQQSARLSEVLTEDGITAATAGDAAPAPTDSVVLVQGSLPGGWVLRHDGRSLTLLTDSEIFGFAKQRRLAPRRAADRGSFLADLSPGDFVVHVEHGIAKFAGLTSLRPEGHDRDYLELHYAAGDRLFVPTDQVDRVSRYVGPGDYTPALTRLGSQDWLRTKERVRRAVADLARELLALYAARQVMEGHSFAPDTPWQQELEASFPYVETPDQLDAVKAVKADMEVSRPMDRLVCGDVGYGKTEVAIRAAFKAVLDGRQVAVLVPTTVLAQQHYQTFRERLASFPARLEMLSRFRSARDQRRVVADLAAGSVDIVIGTHRLLQKDVSFKDLGLVIVDEEQRFGVAHKERLKQMRREVDVLTLSATPIPRTLHMSLTGIRDMSTMETPPEERLPIKTYVLESDDQMVREAIVRELERGGQVYFVHNRVYNIEQVARRLRDLVPEAEVGVAHGQMPEEVLERAMLDFVGGRTDVLVCTTIIESGLDIPNVNTIIINRADTFGLAQLYQLRGRVGRGASRAYAYLLYDRHRALTETAQKRLQTIFEAAELGAGFQIALKDLEIRGAGNLLGAEQSGQIGAVGFDLYVRLLGEAVERLKAIMKGEKPPPSALAQPPLTMDLPLTAHIPEAYVDDLNLRLALYQRMAQVRRPEEADDLAREMADRFGPLPSSVKNLLFVVRLRALARAAGVESIQREDGQVVVRMSEGGRIDKEALPPAAGDGVWVGRTQLRLDTSLLRERWRSTLAELLGALAQSSAPAAQAS